MPELTSNFSIRIPVDPRKFTDVRQAFNDVDRIANLTAGGIINVRGQVVADGVTDANAELQALIDDNPNATLLFEGADFVSDGPLILTDATGRNFQGQIIIRNGRVLFTNDGSATDSDIAMQRGFASYPKVNGVGGDSSGLGDKFLFDYSDGGGVVGPENGASFYAANGTGFRIKGKGKGIVNNRYGILLECCIQVTHDDLWLDDHVNAGIFWAYLGDTARVWYGSAVTPESAYWNDAHRVISPKFTSGTGRCKLAAILDHGSKSEPIRTILNPVSLGHPYFYLGRSHHPTVIGGFTEDDIRGVRILPPNASMGGETNISGVTASQPSGTYARTNFPDGFSLTCRIEDIHFVRCVDYNLDLSGVSQGKGFIGGITFSGLDPAGYHLVMTQPNGLIEDGGCSNITNPGVIPLSISYPGTYLNLSHDLTLSGPLASFTLKSQDGSGSDYKLYNPTGDDFQFAAAGTTFLTIKPTGDLSKLTTGVAGLARSIIEATATSGAVTAASLQLRAYNGASVGVLGALTATSNSWSFGTYVANQLNLTGNGTGGLGLRTSTAPIIIYQGNSDPDFSPEVARFTSGNLGIGTSTVSARLHSVSTTEQFRLGYDAANYVPFTVSVVGDLTIAPSGGDVNLTGTLNTTGRIHALLTTEQGRFSYDANNFAAFTVAASGSLNIAPTGATAANLGLWATSFGTSANKVLAMGNGTAPTTLPSGVIQMWSKDTTAKVSGGTAFTTEGIGSHANLWSHGLAIHNHVAIGDWSDDAAFGDGVDAGINTGFTTSTWLNIRGVFTGDMSATGIEPAVGFTIAKRQGIAVTLKTIATVGLKASDEVYGVRGFIDDWSPTGVTHLGQFIATEGTVIQHELARMEKAFGVKAIYSNESAGNNGDARGVYGLITSSSAGVGTLDFTTAGWFAHIMNGANHIGSGRGVISTLDITVSGALVDVFNHFRASTPVITAGSIVSELVGYECRDQSGIVGVTRSYNFWSKGVNSQNVWEGAMLCGGRPLEADTPPDFGLLQGQSAYGLASTNTTGGDLMLTGGIGKRLFTVLDITLGTVTVTVTVNGTAVTFLSGTDFLYGATTTTAATNLAAAINANSTLNTKVLAVATTNTVYLRRRGLLHTLTIATNQALRISVTSGIEGVIRVPGPGSSTAPALLFSSSAAVPGFYVKNQGSTNQITAVASGGDSAFMVQNLNSGGYSGISFLDNAGAVAVFSGYNNGTGEFRFNNVAGTPSLNFMIGGSSLIKLNATGIGAFGATPVAKPTVTGSRGGNAALASLLTAMANLGWITDSSS